MGSAAIRSGKAKRRQLGYQEVHTAVVSVYGKVCGAGMVEISPDGRLGSLAIGTTDF